MAEATKAVDKDHLAELNDILAPLKANIENTNEALGKIQKLFEKKFAQQQHEILNLQVRIQQLETKLSYQEHVTALHDRKLDDQEQVSRKVNLRLKGIEIIQGDSPIKLKDIIKTEIERLALGIPDEEIDRCHRVGKIYSWGGSSHLPKNKRVQDVLVRFRSWNSRDIMYQRRKDFNFGVFADLTSSRSSLLRYIRELLNVVEGEPTSLAVGRIVNYAFADKNCKIKFRSHAGSFYTVNSEQEFLNLVTRLDDALTLSDIFKADEGNRAKYDMSQEEKTLNEIFW